MYNLVFGVCKRCGRTYPKDMMITWYGGHGVGYGVVCGACQDYLLACDALADLRQAGLDDAADYCAAQPEILAQVILPWDDRPSLVSGWAVVMTEITRRVGDDLRSASVACALAGELQDQAPENWRDALALVRDVSDCVGQRLEKTIRRS